MTALYGVIGDPISHSLSPLIHNKWMRAHAIPATYEAFHIPAGEFIEDTALLKTRGARGLNVTLPHKHDALTAAASKSDAARKIGAANTLSLDDDGHWAADNTDAPGFLKALEMTGFGDLNDKDVLLLGAGGSARALTFALHQQGAALTIANRTVEKAESLSAELTHGQAAIAPLADLATLQDRFDIVINTTSVGYSGDILLLNEGQGRLFFDISYGKVAAAQLAHAKSKGWQTADGLGMLAAQAAFSFDIWFGIMPDIETMVKHLRNVVEATS